MGEVAILLVVLMWLMEICVLVIATAKSHFPYPVNSFSAFIILKTSRFS